MASLTLSNAFLRLAAERLYGKRPEDERLHLVGIRDASPAGASAVEVHPPRPNRFDDTLGAFGSGWLLIPGTVDPGATWAKRPQNPRGTAHLVPGVWTYELGLHKGKRAFVQAGPVTVRRDRDRDGRPENTEPLDSGFFGVNGHRMGRNGPTVDAWSAGCWGAREDAFLRLYTLAASAGQRTFRLWLFRAEDLLKVRVPA